MLTRRESLNIKVLQKYAPTETSHVAVGIEK